EYSCSLEKKARENILEQGCRKIPNRTTFSDTQRNYGYIDARIRNFFRSRSPEQALAEATLEWWDLHWYNNHFKGITPQKDDYPTIPFFLMAHAAHKREGRLRSVTSVQCTRNLLDSARQKLFIFVSLLTYEAQRLSY
ncbi:hypothetical protein OSTOST_19776, partial [Ostertagia ostertagi]